MQNFRVALGICLIIIGIITSWISIWHLGCRVGDATFSPCYWENLYLVSFTTLPIGVGSLVTGLMSIPIFTKKLRMLTIGLWYVGAIFLSISAPFLIVDLERQMAPEKYPCIETCGPPGFAYLSLYVGIFFVAIGFVTRLIDHLNKLP